MPMPGLFTKAITETPNGAQGTAVGEGYAIVGLAFDYTRNKIIGMNFGLADHTLSLPANPSIIVHDPSDLSTVETEYDISGTSTGAFQGVTVLPSGNFLAADKTNGVAREFDGATSEGTLFSLSGINGLYYHRGLGKILASSGTTLYVYSLAGSQESSHNLTAITGGADIDHIFEYGDLAGITWGANGSPGNSAYLDPSDWSLVGEREVHEADSIEGKCHDDSGNAYIGSDGYYHNNESSQDENRIITLRVYPAVTTGRAWTPADIDPSLYGAIAGLVTENAVTSGSTVTSVVDYFDPALTWTAIGSPTLEAAAVNGLDAFNFGDVANRGFTLGRPGGGFAGLYDDPDGTPHFVVGAIDNVDTGVPFSTRSDVVAGPYLSVFGTNISYFNGSLSVFSQLAGVAADTGTHLAGGLFSPDRDDVLVSWDGEHGPPVASGTQTTPSDITVGVRRTSGATGTLSSLGSPDANGARIAELYLCVDSDADRLYDLFLRLTGYLRGKYGVTIANHPYADAVPGIGLPSGGLRTRARGFGRQR